MPKSRDSVEEFGSTTYAKSEYGANGMPDLVPLLVPLCTVILCFLVRQYAMWITRPSNSL